ncbi:ABC transporter permease [Bacillus seohaeanensis]|uniref:ABC transporter permease n=1 Tax=Bacillus seohaeanensis TaxID=284580 RepID=A0ABW5RVQ1_9BACI
MNTYYNLIHNELEKQFSKTRIWIFLGLILLINFLGSLAVYLLFNDISFNYWEFLHITSNFLVVTQMFAVIVASDIISNEFSSGTIKLLLIRPVSRIKVLLSKYSAVLLLVTFFTFISFAFTAIIGMFFYFESIFGFNQNMVPMVVSYFCKWVEIVIYCSLGFGISVVTRHSSISMAITLFLTFSSSTLLIVMEEMNITWGKYLFIANANLNQYFFEQPPFEGMTFSSSVYNLLMHFVLFLGVTVYSFKHRDIEV